MMSIMPRPVDTHVSVQLYKNIQQCFRDIREAAAHSDEEVIQGRIADNGGLLGRVEAVMTILDSRLRRNWHQLALVDEEGGSRRTFQQEIWSEVVRWQSGENPLSIGEIVRNAIRRSSGRHYPRSSHRTSSPHASWSSW